MKYVTATNRANTYNERQRIWFLRFGRKDWVPNDQKIFFCTLKQLALLFRLSVKQVEYRLRIHEKELSEGSDWDREKEKRKDDKRAPAALAEQ